MYNLFLDIYFIQLNTISRFFCLALSRWWWKFCTFAGVVSDATTKPLESANVIAKPLQEKDNLKFSITIINFVRSGASYYPQAGINFLLGMNLKF